MSMRGTSPPAVFAIQHSVSSSSSFAGSPRGRPTLGNRTSSKRGLPERAKYKRKTQLLRAPTRPDFWTDRDLEFDEEQARNQSRMSVFEDFHDASHHRRTIRGNEPHHLRHDRPEWYMVYVTKVKRSGEERARPTSESEQVQSSIVEACHLRDKWLYECPRGEAGVCSAPFEKLPLKFSECKNVPVPLPYTTRMVDGVIHVIDDHDEDIFTVNDLSEFLADLNAILRLIAFGPAKTFCYRRLNILERRFELYLMLNHDVEVSECKSIGHRDFYNVRKVDNHVHHSACMNQKHLLSFIKSQVKRNGDVVVDKRKIEGSDQVIDVTLREIFDEMDIDPRELNIDMLDMHAHQETFQRFDRFNAKYNPVGKGKLREVFLKIDNHCQGRFLAQITKEVFAEHEFQRYQMAEYRLSIYGKKPTEWDTMARWICSNDLRSTCVRWLIQVPRIYHIFRRANLVQNFAEMIHNIFQPLFEVTLDPNSHQDLHCFLQHVVGFDSVDDESKPEQLRVEYPTPQEWDSAENPPYVYYAYYMYANLYILNQLREERGLNTFSFRPHAGEAGGVDHIAATFLVANSINHGIQLKKHPVLQYLYYLKQVGISISPLSNNILFVKYDKSPISRLFKRGLNVSLSTDDPLLIHYTKDALLEEFSIVAQVFNLSSVDMCELARNSVLQCGWDAQTKKEWIGENFLLLGADGNDIHRTNVPDVRLEFRNLLLKEEMDFLQGVEVYQSQFDLLTSAVSRRNRDLFTGGASVFSEDFDDDESKEAGDMRESIRQESLGLNSPRLRDLANQLLNEARDLAEQASADVTLPVPHDEWVKLARAKKQLEEMEKMLEIRQSRSPKVTFATESMPDQRA